MTVGSPSMAADGCGCSAESVREGGNLREGGKEGGANSHGIRRLLRFMAQTGSLF